MGFDAEIDALKLELPPAPKPAGTYVPVLRVHDLLYVSGHGPLLPDGTLMRGRVGEDLDVEAGYAAARQVGLTMLATLRDQLGSLDAIDRIVKTLGMVNCAPDFGDQPKVINGFSDLMVQVFGDAAGTGTRSAVGMGSLPSNIPVEVEAIFQLRS